MKITQEQMGRLKDKCDRTIPITVRKRPMIRSINMYARMEKGESQDQPFSRNNSRKHDQARYRCMDTYRIDFQPAYND